MQNVRSFYFKSEQYSLQNKDLFISDIIALLSIRFNSIIALGIYSVEVVFSEKSCQIPLSGKPGLVNQLEFVPD